MKYVVNINDVMDFNFCPNYQKYKSQRYKTLIGEYNQALEKIYYSCLRTFINSPDYVSNVLGSLKTAWGEQWIGEDNYASLELRPVNPERDKKGSRRRSGWDALEAFGEFLMEEQCPIISNRAYKLVLSEDVALIGRWQYIREIGPKDDKRYQIVKILPETTRRYNDPELDRGWLDLTAMLYAFKVIFGRDAELLIFDPHRVKNRTAVAFRYEKDFNKLKRAVFAYIKQKKHKLYYVSPDIRCSSCEYRDLCNRE